MVSDLYRIKPKDDSDVNDKKNKKHTPINSDDEGEIIGRVSPIRALAFKMCCCCSICLKRSRNERIFQKSKKKLAKELDIIDFLKFVREVKSFIKFSVSDEHHMK